MILRLILFFVVAISVHAADPYYDHVIVVPASASKELKSTGEELARWLKEMTSRAFAISTNAASHGIHLRRAADHNTILKERGSEAFRIISTPNDTKLLIVGNSDQAVRHGVYFYLEQLGCRWLLPSEHWTVIPKRNSIRLTIHQISEPAFRLRSFSGTGGFGGKLPVDPEMKLQARWGIWKERNRLGGDIQPGGHTGEAFNTKYRKQLEAHPEFRAELKGERQPWGITTKLCISNPELRKLYVEDRVAMFRKTIERFPDSPRSQTTSVEPADGTGHCECAGCREIGTVSDRVFTLANEAARAVAKEFPGKLVNLYAYNEHAAPPYFSLEPNVFTMIAPYAFQRTGLTGDELVKRWGTHSSQLGIYDYWSIPDWANCLPQISYTRHVPQKLRFWHEQGTTAFLGESSYSAGNVGIVWYLAARLMWDPKTDESAVLDEFFELAFGSSKKPMRAMLDRWADDFILSEHELGLSFRDLKAALSLAPDDTIRARINDFAIYVEYLRLWREYQGAKRDSSERIDHAKTLIRYLWRIYPTAMVHSYRMFQLISYRYERANKELLDLWPLKNAEAPAWKDLPPITETEIESYVSNGIRSFTPLEFERRNYSDGLVPLHKPETISTNLVQSPPFSGTHEFEFWAPESAKLLTIHIRCGKRGNYPGNQVTVTDAKGKRVLEHLAPSDGEWHEVAIPIATPGHHRMTITDQKIFVTLKVPDNLPFVVTGWKACPALPSKVYFKLPEDLSRIAITSDSVVPLHVKNSAGKLMEHPDRKLFVVDIPESERGTIWTISNFKAYTPMKFLNAPNVFAFSPKGLMVPGNTR